MMIGGKRLGDCTREDIERYVAKESRAAIRKLSSGRR